MQWQKRWCAPGYLNLICKMALFGKKGYTKPMYLLKLISVLFSVIKESKTAGATVVMSTALAAGGYALVDLVNAKHQEAIAKISQNRAQVTQLLFAQQKVLVKLDAIKDGIDETKKQVVKTSDRVWQIAQDVSILKSKTR